MSISSINVVISDRNSFGKKSSSRPSSFSNFFNWSSAFVELMNGITGTINSKNFTLSFLCTQSMKPDI